MPVIIPTDPEALLTSRQLAAALTEAGYPIAHGTLNTKVSRGGGPAYQKWGPTRLYRWGSALAWAQDYLTAPACSSAEHRRLRRAARQAAPAAKPPLTPAP
jgi:hypothetical protein